jgi:hypothetical protein
LKRHSIHIAQQIRAFFLVSVLFLAFSAKGVHYFTEHHHEEAVEFCHSENEQHLHDYEHVAHNCDLCDFTFSLFTFELPTFCFEPKLTPDFVETTFFYTNPFWSNSFQFAALRAPPRIG